MSSQPAYSTQNSILSTRSITNSNVHGCVYSCVRLTQSIPAHYKLTRGDDCAHTVLKHVEKVEYSRDGPPRFYCTTGLSLQRGMRETNSRAPSAVTVGSSCIAPFR
ncbi:hypothetical protein PV327_000502 [Microctonus hyperodae]|uniref:Uncharacterized protein n=1 Tax=Microctonus hyperodae TaxID=165561 RepID=A0AA39G6N7_MICHY|nr:hypothetical protein PV327_000502 [Microctonus hyperodae]